LWAKSRGNGRKPLMPLWAIILRDLSEAARRKRTFVARFVYGALLALPVLGYYLLEGRTQGIGRVLFQTFTVWQVILLTFIAPVSAAGTIATERANGTLELVLLTRLRPWGIVAGKLAVEFGRALILLLSGLPILFFCTMFGGVSADQILQAFVVTGVFTLSLVTLGLACSSHFPDARNALWGVYLSIIVLGILVPMAPGFVPSFGILGELPDVILLALECYHPGYVLGSSVFGQSGWGMVERYVLVTLALRRRATIT
jgi:ABC-type transport system involved in multi-copper enzyme maturation permease subunit